MFCPKCKKPFRTPYDHDRFEKSEHFSRACDEFKPSVRFKDDFICERFLCSEDFKVRLGGLQGGLNFRMRQLIGCVVTMKIECGEDTEEITAKICFVGSDYVEVEVLENDDVENDEDGNNDEDSEECKKKEKADFLILPTERVKWIKVKDDCDCDCDCDCHKHHKCHKHHCCDCY